MTSMNYKLEQMKKKFNKDVKRLIKHLFYECEFYNYDYANASLEDKLDLKLPRIKKDIIYVGHTAKEKFYEPYRIIPKNALPKNFREKMKSYGAIEIYVDSPKDIENMTYQPHLYADKSYHPNSMLVSESDLERNAQNISEFRLVGDWERQRWLDHELGMIDYSYYKVAPYSREIVVEITLAAPKKKIDSLEKTIHSVIYS
jgi:hypothetical protein